MVRRPRLSSPPQQPMHGVPPALVPSLQLAVLLVLVTSHGSCAAAQPQPLSPRVIPFTLGTVNTVSYGDGKACSVPNSAPPWCSNACVKVLRGYQFAMEKLQASPLVVKDRNGSPYLVNFSFVVKDDQCNEKRHGELMREMAQRRGVYVVLGASAQTVQNDSSLMHSAGRMLVNAIVDPLESEGRKYVYYMAPPLSRVFNQLVKEMAGKGIQSVAVAYEADVNYAVGSCQDIARYVDSLKAFAPGFSLAGVVPFNLTPFVPVATYGSMVQQLIDTGAEAVILCTSGNTQSSLVHRAIVASGHYFKAVFNQWFDVNALTKVVAANLSASSAEGVMGFSYWSPQVAYHDDLFGWASDYFTEFQQFAKAYYGWSVAPDYFAVQASTAVNVVRLAVQATLQMCDLSNAAEDMDSFMFNASYSICRDPISGSRSPLTVYQLLLNSMDATFLQTVAGTVEFNSLGYNAQIPTLITQLRNGSFGIALPSDYSTVPLVMPLPPPPPPPSPSPPPPSPIPPSPVPPPDTPWISSAAGIGVVTALAACTALLLAAGAWRLYSMRLKSEQLGKAFKQLVTIPASALQVKALPSLELPGGCGAGRGVYQSSDVQLTRLMEGVEHVQLQMLRKGLSVSKLKGGGSSAGGLAKEGEGRDAAACSSPAAASLSADITEGLPQRQRPFNEEALRIALASHDFMPRPQPQKSAKSIASRMASMSGLSRVMSVEKQQELLAESVWLYMRMPHERIVTIHGVCWEKGPFPMLVSEAPALGSLSSLLGNETISTALHTKGQICMQVAEALAFLHSKGVCMKSPIMPAVWLNESSLSLSHMSAKLSLVHLAIAGAGATAGVDADADDTAHELEDDVVAFGRFVGKVFKPQALASGDEGRGSIGQEPSVSCSEEQQLAAGLGFTMPGEELSLDLATVPAVLQPLVQRCCGLLPERPSMLDVVAALKELQPQLLGIRAENCQLPLPILLSNMFKSSQRSDDMLNEIFPPKVAQALQLGLAIQPEHYEEVAIFFSDIVGYTDICKQMRAEEVMDLLNRLYVRFDAITRNLGLFKVETIGDAYMAVSNLKVHDPAAHARKISVFSFSVVEAANNVQVHPNRPELGTVNIRVGLHSGPVVANVVGTMNRRYCLFGDTVNTASRMESNSERNRVHCSKDFAVLVRRQWPELVLESRGVRDIKGKGLMETFFMKKPQAATPSEVAA